MVESKVPWNSIFVGRGPLLDRLTTAFSTWVGVAAPVQVIHGLGDVGKTQIAVR